MSDVYVRIKALCKAQKKTVKQLCADTGIGASTFSDLNAGRTKELSAATLRKIAAYFDVSMDYLLGTEKEPVSESDELWEYLQLLKDKPGLKVLLDHTKNATQEDIEAIVRVLGIGGGNDD